MTMPSDPFQQEVAPANPASAAQEWTQALNDPKVRSTLLNVGLQLMQPPSFGQTTSGQVAQAIGAAGEGFSRADAEDRAQAEQDRKGRDTDSQIDYRADRTENAAQGLEIQRLRTGIQADAERSRAEERASKIRLNAARIPGLEAQAEMLRMKSQAFPQDMEAKIALQRAQAALLEAKTEVAAEQAAMVQPQAQARIQRDQSAAGLSDRRGAAVDSNAEVARRRVEAQENSTRAKLSLGDVRSENQRRRDYSNLKKEHDKQQTMEPARNRKPFPIYSEWVKTFDAPSEAPAPAAPGAPAPAAPAPVKASELPAMPMKKEELKVGQRYMTPKGPLTWNGSKMVE